MSVLGEHDRARLEQVRRDVYAQTPDVVPAIADLARHGLITGWRNVVYVGPPRAIAGVRSDVYLASSQALRTKNGIVTDDVQ